jgi:hypothetical protein
MRLVLSTLGDLEFLADRGECEPARMEGRGFAIEEVGDRQSCNGRGSARADC